MSRFSTYLEQLIHNSGESISSISKNSGVERTSIHKALTDSRTLSYKNARRLAEYLRLSPLETQIFMEYHSMQIQGEESYELRRQVARFFSSMASLQPVDEKEPVPQINLKNQPKEDQYFLSGEFPVRILIHKMIRAELQKEEPCIYMVLPADDDFLLNYIYSLYAQYQTDLKILHIFSLQTGGDTENILRGIHILKNTLTLSLAAKSAYRPYYFYTRAEFFATPFPYYLLTSDNLLCIGRQWENVCFFDKQVMLDHFREFFFRTLEYCSPLLHFYDNPFDILNAYAQYGTEGSFFEIMPQPCFGRFFTRDFFAAKLRKDHPSYHLLVDKYDEIYGRLRDLKGHYTTIFTQAGLQEFMETGRFSVSSETISEPCTPEERHRLLSALAEGIENDTIIGRLINSSRLPIPSYLRFLSSDQGQLEIFSIADEKHPDIYHTNITQTDISSAFLDFFSYLPRSEYVLGKKQTLDYLRSLLKTE